MLPWFFAADRVNYSRYASVALRRGALETSVGKCIMNPAVRNIEQLGGGVIPSGDMVHGSSSYFYCIRMLFHAFFNEICYITNYK